MKHPKQTRSAAARLAALTVPLSLATLAQTPSPAPAGINSEYVIEDAGFTYSSGSSTIELFPRINEDGQVASQLETKGTFGARTNAALSGFTLLDPLPDDFGTEVGDVNDSGSMAGSSFGQNGSHAVRYRNGVTEDLGLFGKGATSEGLGINNAGDVVGGIRSLFSAPQAFVKRNGQDPEFPTNSESFDFGQAADISDAGTALVNARPSETSISRAYRFTEGELNEVPLLRGGNFSRGYGINDTDEVVGEAGALSFSNPRDRLHRKSSVSYGLSGPAPRGISSFSHAFRHTPGETPEDLGTLGDDESSVAYGINNDGDVVGESGGVAFIYQDGRGMRNLNDLIPPKSGWSLREATGINNSGQIVGTGRFNGSLRVFRLTPRPTGEGGLRVGPASVNFGRIGIGRYGVARLTVTNTSSSSISAFIADPDKPFSIRVPETGDRIGSEGVAKPGVQGKVPGSFIFLEPGQRIQIRSYFVPRKRRRHQSRIVVGPVSGFAGPRGSNQPIRVRLTGTGC